MSGVADAIGGRGERVVRIIRNATLTNADRTSDGAPFIKPQPERRTRNDADGDGEGMLWSTRRMTTVAAAASVGGEGGTPEAGGSELLRLDPNSADVMMDEEKKAVDALRKQAGRLGRAIGKSKERQRKIQAQLDGHRRAMRDAIRASGALQRDIDGRALSALTGNIMGGFIQLLGQMAERLVPRPTRLEAVLECIAAGPGGDWFRTVMEEEVRRKVAALEENDRHLAHSDKVQHT